MPGMPGTVRTQRVVKAAAAAGAALMACAGCTAPTTSAPNEPGTPIQKASASAPTVSPATPAVSAGRVISLDCRDGLSGLNSEGARTFLGVDTDVWNADFANFDMSNGPMYRGSTLVKSVLNVSAAAGPGTRIEITSPATAGLYYTSWGVWGHSTTDKGVVTSARRAVTVGGCGSEVVGFPGGFVVHGPSCVSMRITSADGGTHRDLRIPIGRSCGHK